MERHVLETVRNLTDYWVLVGVGGSEIKATRTHRFWVESEATWIPAIELKAGMTVRLADGRLVAVEYAKVVALAQSEKTFNLGIEKDHDYFVGLSRVLVHNGQAEDEEQRRLQQRRGPNGGERSKQDQQRVDDQRQRRNERRENESRAENGQNRSGEGSRAKNASESRGKDQQASQAAERERNVRENRSGRERNVGIGEEHSMKGNAPGKGGKC